MEVILSLLPPTSPNSAPAPVAAASSVALSPLSVLAALPPGKILQGFVLNRDAGGNPILRTASGDFLLKTPFFLKIGSDVELRVSGTGQNIRANLLTVDGLPPGEAENIPAHAQDTDMVTSEKPAPAATQAAATGAPARAASAFLAATLLTPATAAPEGVALPPAGAALNLKLSNVTLPSELEAKLALENTPQPAAIAAYAKAAPTLPAAFSTPAPVQVLPSGEYAMQAQVVSLTAAGQPVLQTPIGLLQLEQHQALPVGATLTLTLSVPSTQGTQLPPASTAELATGWQTLQMVLDAIKADLPQTAQMLAASLSPILPQQGNDAPQPQNLKQGLMFFLSALGIGSAEALIGARAKRELQENPATRPLLAKFEAEFGQMRELWFSAPPSGWQAMFAPFLMEGEMRPLRLFVKRDRESHATPTGREETELTRFVVEMNLSALGAVQMDGFVRQTDATRFDLYLRTEHELDDETRSNIQGIFESASDYAGFTGSLVFQQTGDFPVKPLEEMLAAEHREVVV